MENNDNTAPAFSSNTDNRNQGERVQGYVPNQEGYFHNRGGFVPNQGRFVSNRGGFVPNRAGFISNQGGFVPNRVGYGGNRGGYQYNNQQQHRGSYRGKHGAYQPKVENQEESQEGENNSNQREQDQTRLQNRFYPKCGNLHTRKGKQEKTAEDIQLSLSRLNLREQKRDEVNNSKEESLEKNGELTLFYEPDQWSSLYRTHYSHDFLESSKIIGKMMDLDDDEAEKELLRILMKVTLIESHLAINGALKADELFCRMRFPNKVYTPAPPKKKEVDLSLFVPEPDLDEIDFFAVKPTENYVSDDEDEEDEEEEEDVEKAEDDDQEPTPRSASPEPESNVELVEDEDPTDEIDIPERLRKRFEQQIPFSSAEELQEFMESMVPVFRYQPMSREWVNTGVQTRRFSQWMKQEMDDGVHFSWENFKKDYAKFKTTIQVEEKLRDFAEKEMMVDYSHYSDFGFRVPGFQYDEESRILSLSSEAASRLPLLLPIFTNTIHSSNKFKMDKSRLVSTFIWQKCSMMSGKSTGIVCGGPLRGRTTALYKKRMEKQIPLADSTFISVSGYIWPNSERQNVEIFQMETCPFDYFNTPAIGSSGFLLAQNSEKQTPSFESFIASQKAQIEDSYDTRVVVKEESSTKNEDEMSMRKRILEKKLEEKIAAEKAQKVLRRQP